MKYEGSLLLEDLKEKYGEKTDLAILCYSKEEWDAVLTLHKGRSLTSKPKGAIYIGGCWSEIGHAERLYPCITAKDFIAANIKNPIYEIY